MIAQVIPIREPIIRTEWLLTAYAHFENPLKRVVLLGCGHRVVSTRSKRTRCLRCEEMMRRSLTDGSEDYVAYRAGEMPDRMEWADDPFRGLNESRNS